MHVLFFHPGEFFDLRVITPKIEHPRSAWLHWREDDWRDFAGDCSVGSRTRSKLCLPDSFDDIYRELQFLFFEKTRRIRNFWSQWHWLSQRTSDLLLHSLSIHSKRQASKRMRQLTRWSRVYVQNQNPGVLPAREYCLQHCGKTLHVHTNYTYICMLILYSFQWTLWTQRKAFDWLTLMDVSYLLNITITVVLK